jgi:glycosyltransferase involved in cell wall biosynthesis
MINSDTPTISVIVCVYNANDIIISGQRTIFSCLKNLANQSYPLKKYEILIIDDESTDGSFDLLLNFINNELDFESSIRLLRIEHGGLSVARNFGIKSAIGEIIAFIDQDAIPEIDWLVNISIPFKFNADFTGGQINLLNSDNWVSKFLQKTRYKQFFGPEIYHNQFVGCNMAIKKDVFIKMGGFHENFISYGDESTFFERINGNFKYLPATNATVFHKQPNSIKSFFKISWKSATLYFLCKKASEKKVSFREFISILEQFLLVIFFFSFFALFFQNYFFLPFLIVSFIAVIRRLFIQPLNRALFKGLIKDYGIFWGTIGHVFYSLSLETIVFFGKIHSIFKYRKEKIISPMTTTPIVINDFNFIKSR